MNDIATRQSTEVGHTADNYFASYGDQVSRTSIIGSLLKFNKGDYLAGEDEDELPEGTQLVANMDELMVGWIRWFDKKPTDQIMGRVAEGYQPPRRSELGDEDKGKWEVDAQGREQDPWSFSNYLLLKATDGEDIYTFTTASKGGLSAIGELCKGYGKLMRQKPDEFPIIELATDSYTHKEYGRIKTPKLKIVGWAPKSEFAEALAAEGGTEPAEDPKPAPAAKGSKGKAAAQETRF